MNRKSVGDRFAPNAQEALWCTGCDMTTCIPSATDSSEVRQLLRDMFDAAVAAAQPALCVPQHLPASPKGRLVVIGAGKASAAMARAVEDHWTGPVSGVVVTRYGYAVQCRRIQVIEAAHPVADAAGQAAAELVMKAVSDLTADDLVLCLISGGGSALLPLLPSGLTLADDQALSSALLASGASISEMNCVRRHLSAIKGGRLAVACHPARVVNLLLSDIPGDDPVDIASGPTVADPTTCNDALEILLRYNIQLPPRALLLLTSGKAETVKPGDPRLPSIVTHVIATPRMALSAAAGVARRAGYATYVLSDAIEGESRDVGKALAAMAIHTARQGEPFSTPCVLLSGGETTVSVRGNGRGGRNVEFLLSLAIALDGEPDVYAIACDTDGVDGQEEIAGAVVTPDTLQRALKGGLRPRRHLDNNDAHGFFEALGDSVVCGPTLTNVNDFRAIFVGVTSGRTSDSNRN